MVCPSRSFDGVLAFCAVAACSFALSGCAESARSGIPFEGSSETLVVSGQYERLELERIDAVAVEGRSLTFSGPSGQAMVDLPETVDLVKPSRHWALVTEADRGSTRALTFTDAQSLDDFTVELPASDAPVRYGAFASVMGGDVVIFAWGEANQCYWAFVTVSRRP